MSDSIEDSPQSAEIGMVPIRHPNFRRSAKPPMFKKVIRLFRYYKKFRTTAKGDKWLLNPSKSQIRIVLQQWSVVIITN